MTRRKQVTGNTLFDDAGEVLRDCAGLSIRLAARQVTRFLDARLQKTGLRIAQFGLMAYIAAARDDTIGVLAERAGLDQSTLSRNLRNLERAGLIEIAIVEKDLRRRAVWLTEKGALKLAAAIPVWRQAHDALRKSSIRVLSESLCGLIRNCQTFADPTRCENVSGSSNRCSNKTYDSHWRPAYCCAGKSVASIGLAHGRKAQYDTATLATSCRAQELRLYTKVDEDMTRIDNARVIRAPRGTELSAKSWLTEAPLRMLMNNLDPEVAERPSELVVYGGIGRAARDWESFDRIVAAFASSKGTRRSSSSPASRSACSARTAMPRAC